MSPQSYSSKIRGTAPNLNPIRPVANQGKKLRPCFLLIAEAAQHRRCDCRGVLLLYPAHHHTEMAGLDHHAHTLRLDGLLNRLRNLGGKPFLDLQTARE